MKKIIIILTIVIAFIGCSKDENKEKYDYYRELLEDRPWTLVLDEDTYIPRVSDYFRIVFTSEGNIEAIASRTHLGWWSLSKDKLIINVDLPDDSDLKKEWEFFIIHATEKPRLHFDLEYFIDNNGEQKLCYGLLRWEITPT